MSTLIKKYFSNTLIAFTFLAFALSSCIDDGLISNNNDQLSFSVDTLMFDTIFTTIGSTTQSFTVKNPHLQSIKIENIRLAGGDNSPYRLNIDGKMTNDISDVKIPPNDSIYIFVEITVDPNGESLPIVVQDSIVFDTKSGSQDIDLMAWGQDFVPINKEVITTTTWTADKPYVVYDTTIIAYNETLTIEPGAKVYFHKGAGLYVLGAVNALGTPDMPIIFTCDRLEAMYNDIPGQWDGIILYPNKFNNIFNNVEILNANIGLQVGTLEYDGYAKATLHNVKIEHMSFACIFALKSQIDATNSLFGDCGSFSVALLTGGEYYFNHCTVANYWGGIGYPPRDRPSVIISNQLLYDNVLYSGEQITKWRNSIVWGNATVKSEVNFGHNENFLFDFEFDNCIVKLDDSTYNATPDNYKSVIIEDPKFIDYNTYNYQLDTLSPAIDAGLIDFGELVPFDINDISRLSDIAPDLGVYERIEGNEE